MSGELCYAYGDGHLAYKSGDGRLIFKSAKVKEYGHIVVNATFEPKAEDFYPNAYVGHDMNVDCVYDSGWDWSQDKKKEYLKDAEGYAYRFTISLNVRRGGNFAVRWWSFWFLQSHSSTVTVAFTLDGRDAGGFTAASGESEQSRSFRLSADGSSILGL